MAEKPGETSRLAIEDSRRLKAEKRGIKYSATDMSNVRLLYKTEYWKAQLIFDN